MSYTGTQVYFPASTSADVVRAVLATRFADAKLTGPDSGLRLAFDDTKVIRVSRDDSSDVREEAQWHGAKAEPVIRDALARATQRYVIVPDDPRVDPDDVYNELLLVFEVLRGMPGAVGSDPFDGALYLDNPAQ